MFGNTALALTAFDQIGYGHAGGKFEVQRRGASCFWDLCRAARRQRFWSALRGQPDRLPLLAEILDGQFVLGRHSIGLQEVALAAIVGSEARSDDFDRAFRPLRPHHFSRWLSIFVARESGVTLPPVKLIRIGKRYFVRDGHHRISVAKALGQMEIDASVTVWNLRPK